MSREKRKLVTPKLSTYSYYKSQVNTESRSKTSRSGTLIRVIRSIRSRLSFFRLIIFFCILAVIGYMLSAETDPIIRFSSSEVNARDTSLYRSESQKIIGGSIFNRSKILFDYQSVEEDIKARFPEVESLRISFDLIGRKPVIQLQMQEPAYLYQANGATWVIDTRGIALGLRSDLKDAYAASLHTIVDEGSSSGEIGKTLMSSQQVNFLSTVISLLEKQQVVISGIYVPQNPKQLDLVVAGGEWRYKLSTVEQATSQAGTLIAARATLAANGNTPTEYVDLRSGEKVYWK